ncbi:Variant SH3 domain protein [Methanococcus vannielii SB]|uniref:Variant SH3 domain protein n=1 Tax=Methanococcus vannielii (strain ATCC 35089 / DSM 1224 / JCM 13029 / OCM 148 / SB) TaxID=406327 RepID=A6UQG0_METVS|nr:SH3 domain-containing protein [Methanococcus vannielii]ABR54732.1 Variant SH3 domain protein [Methanococcus vannielii SB]
MGNYIVIKERKSEAEKPIQLVKGETVECIEESDDNSDWAGWILCKGINKEGWVPKQIVERTNNQGLILDDYDAIEFDLEVGEVIIAEKVLNGWAYGAKKDDPLGKAWAPLNHLQIM